MISSELLEMLRCPIDPRRKSPLVLEGLGLVCQRCGTVFPIKDGFPVLVPEEAELAPGCGTLEEASDRHLAPPDPADQAPG